MKATSILCAAALALCLFTVSLAQNIAFAQPVAGEGWGHGPMHGRGGWGRGPMAGGGHHGMARHRDYMHGSLPDRFRGATNPIQPSAANLAAGKQLYAEQCGSCHGANGRGDGEAGRDLSPPPADLAFVISRPVATDEFLLWTISEGGEKFGSAMPAFEETLEKDEIWKIIAYMRSEFSL